MHRIGGVSGRIVDPQEGQNLPLLLKIKFTGRKIIGRLFFLPVEKDGFFHPAGFPTFPPSDVQEIVPFSVCMEQIWHSGEVLEKYPFDETFDGYCFMEDDDIAYRISREYVKYVHTSCQAPALRITSLARL